MSTLSTIPPLLEIGRAETRIWPLDITPTVTAMGVTGPTTPTVSVVDPVTGSAVAGAVSGSPTLVGNIITATIIGSVLTLAKIYQLLWSVVVGGQTVEWVTQLSVVA